MFAEKFGGTPYLMNTPAIVGSDAIRRSLMSDSSFQQIREMWKRLNVVVLGAGGLGKDSSMFRAGIFSASELEAMQEAGGVAACNFILFDEEGNAVRAEVADRVVKLPLNELKHVEHRILIAGGRNKAHALGAVLRSQLATALITDVESAQALLREGTERPGARRPEGREEHVAPPCLRAPAERLRRAVQTAWRL